jgi:hypothetical protein
MELRPGQGSLPLLRLLSLAAFGRLVSASVASERVSVCVCLCLCDLLAARPPTRTRKIKRKVSQLVSVKPRVGRL